MRIRTAGVVALVVSHILDIALWLARPQVPRGGGGLDGPSAAENT